MAMLVFTAAILTSLPRVKNTIVNSARKELVTTTNLAAASAESLYENTLRNYMRGITETNLSTLNYLYSQHQAGKLSKADVIDQFEEIILSQVVGETGYMVVSDISKGKNNITAAIHPYIKGQRVEGYDFIQQMYQQKNGYFETTWKNPGDLAARQKVGYMSYFEPWQWIISVNPYKDELKSLVDIEDFENSLSKVQPTTLEGSYITILDDKGNLLYHPSFKEKSAIYFQDTKTGSYFIQDMLDTIKQQYKGDVVDGWQEFSYRQRGNESVAVDKLMYYHYMPDQKWVVITVINKNEILKPYNHLLYRLATVGVALFLGLTLLAFLSGSFLSRRINGLVSAAKMLAGNNYNIKLKRKAFDEIGDLEEAFDATASTINQLISEQKQLNISLEEKVERRTRELEFKNKELESLYVTDSLTGLSSRNKLDEVLDCEVNRSQRYGTVFGIILLDVDYFKPVNDVYGHQVGDVVLKEFSTVLKSHSRKTDVVGRWGGEEFMIICSNTDLDGLLFLANELKSKVSAFQFSVSEQKTASFGVAVYENDETSDSIIKRADDALYRAKKNGRNRVEHQ
ncbi:diguanylate cyclase [Bacterioplanoides sp. SCSIO 12839]|uniref:sensor domain-containing diguanylate cyclase n=1 Tax=Bacterioplanoides sp. SCSIO 12839 TaxID=2829569 RepID=UPI002101F4BA|nr:diguanylate cyclase [Bacterioplanoides sp. SCSIO 12839]UTW49613.1 diguanylate cyclase [Bacterioplanoides sp. SCSIO 12839]